MASMVRNFVKGHAYRGVTVLQPERERGQGGPLNEDGRPGDVQNHKEGRGQTRVREAEVGPAFTDIIKELRSIAKVPVYVDMRDRLMEGADMDSILIDRVKMLDLIEAYEFMRASVYRAWLNLPEPPVSETTHAFTWMLSAENYCIKNHTGSGLLTRENVCEEFSSYDIYVGMTVPKKDMVDITAMIAKQS
ncbi:hypothetical protein DL764_005704 [Monosporascus ibericus]|uniref:Uncharacterized protein n=1 Tax=Monosporascus ibericus TaxID=155417 RepID=A0A4Q4T9X6_9PEZI|nr:hypothetical protein DL764_005704 [Monosporascus ibericus]